METTQTSKQIQTPDAIRIIDSIVSGYKSDRKERVLIDQSMKVLAEKATGFDVAITENEGLKKRVEELELLIKGPAAKVETLGG